MTIAERVTDLIATSSPQEEWAGGDSPAEDLLARLTQAAYAVALRHDSGHSFAELELTIWRELRLVLNDSAVPQEAA
jgi:hypothetical protein